MLTLAMAVLCVLIQVVLLYLPVRRSLRLAAQALEKSDKSADMNVACDAESSSSKYLAPSDDDQPVAHDGLKRDAGVDEVGNICCDEETVVSTVSILLAFALATIFIFVTVHWTIRICTYHRSAVGDLMKQLTNSTDTALGTSLKDAQKMVKQAHNIWELTGKTVICTTTHSR